MSKKENIVIGGQAVIEGVMMRSPHFYVVALRRNNGEITVNKQHINSLSQKWAFLKLPLLRGLTVIIESLVIGIRTLAYSANIFAKDTVEGGIEKMIGHKTTKEKKEDKLSILMLVLTVIFSLLLGIFIFIILPLGITQYLKVDIFEFKGPVIFNLIDGFLRIAIFFIYILAISLMKDVRRVFQYHGAEHKAVYTYESDKELVVEKARNFSTLHPRCGTSFLIVVMVISIFVFSLFKPSSLLEKFLIRLVSIPFIAGISYEIIKYSAKMRLNPLMKIFILPGLFLQRLTTSIPDDAQIEVALVALNEVLKLEQN